MIRILFFSLLILGCASHQSLTRSVVNTSLSGIVVDKDGAPIAGVEVVAVTPEQKRLATVTDSDGRFAFFVLEPGAYDVFAQKKGYWPVSKTNLNVRDGHEHPVEITLPPTFAPADLSPPRFISGPSPKYTKEALEHGVHGTFIAKCVITVEGAVRDCRILRSVKYMEDAVIGALQARRYHPATREGKPLEVDYTFKLNLSLP